MTARRKARELTVQFLYGLDIKGEKFSRLELERFWASQDAATDVREFAGRLITGTVENQENIDGIIRSYAENWSLDRLAVVDRNVLRLAVYEILKEKDIPFRVTVNEAIDIARKFSSDESGAFVNGLLDKIGKVFGKDKDTPG